MQRITTATKAVDLFGAGKHGFKDGNPGLGIVATQLSAAIFNSIQEELCAIIEAAGITLDEANRAQLAAALQSGKLLSATAGGTADAITATFAPAIATLTAGMKVRVRAASANATATPTFAANALAAKTIVKANGVELVAGDIAGAGHWLYLTYDATLDVWVLGNPAATFASNAEAQALSITNKVISPGTLAAAFQGSNQSLATGGYQKLPGGLILQWGSVTLSSASTGTANESTVTFPIAFPTSVYGVYPSHKQTSGALDGILQHYTRSHTSTNFIAGLDDNVTGASTETFQWFALGK